MNKTRVPKASPEPIPELATFLEPFAPLFRRHTSRESMERYLTGLLTDLPHKTCETIAEVIAGTSLERLVLLAHARWVIEQFYEDAKQECGLDHFQGRSWEGLHRHLALSMLAYSFLMFYRLTLPLPPDEVFPPLRHAKLAAFRASPGAALALPGSRSLAAPHPADRLLPSQTKLTE